MNNYITLILPFVVYNVFNAIAVFMGLPIYLDITYLMMPELLVDLGFQASAPIYWLYIQGFFIVLIVLLGWVFTRRVKRRLEDVQ